VDREQVLGLIDALRSDEALRHELRSVLLTQELLELPERFAAFVTEVRGFVAATEARFERIEADMAVLKTDVAVLKTDVAVLKTDVAVLKTDVARLKGSDYEQQARVKGAAYLGTAGFRRARLLATEDLAELCEDALDADRITPEEVRDVLAADVVFSARWDGEVVHVVGEVAGRVHVDDVERAERRAGTLSKATGVRAMPMVLGASVDDPAELLAGRRGVAVVSPVGWSATS
jgi:predicted RecB family endonuclease